jgi:hypothetical protein
VNDQVEAARPPERRSQPGGHRHPLLGRHRPG